MPRLQYSNKRDSSSSSRDSDKDVKKSKSDRSPYKGRRSPGRKSPRRSRSPGHRRSPGRRRSTPRRRSYSRSPRRRGRYSPHRRSRSPRRRSRSRSHRRSPPGRKSPPRRSPRRKSPVRKPTPKEVPKREPTPPGVTEKKETSVTHKPSPEAEPHVSKNLETSNVKQISTAAAPSTAVKPAKPPAPDKPSHDRKHSPPPRRKSSYSPRRSRSPRGRSHTPKHSRSLRNRSRSPRRQPSRSPHRHSSRSPRQHNSPPRKRSPRHSRSSKSPHRRKSARDEVALKPEHRLPKHVVEEEEKMLYGDTDDRGGAEQYGRQERWQDRDERRGEWVRPAEEFPGDKDERSLITQFRPDEESVYMNNPGYILPKETPKQSLHSRFTGSRVKPFSFGENITVGIERNIRGNSPARYGPFSASDILIPRRDNEGDLPLCKREEFEEKEEYVERRVVKVSADRTSALSRYEERYQQRENFEVRSDRFQSNQDHVPLSERWKDSRRSRSRSRGRRSRDRSPGPSRERRDERHFRNRDDGRSDRDQRVVLDRSSLRDEDTRFSVVVPSSDRDDRIVSDRGFHRDDLRRNDLRRTIHKSPDGRYERDPRDLRFNLNRRGRGGFDARMKIERRGDGRDDSLPDFSKRPDKFRDESWRDDPASIPKNSYYFEHDNRDQDKWGFRGRGRGRFAFRGQRGSFRGRFVNRYNEHDGEWKHDKYKEVEDDKDKEPTSTTK